MPTVAACVPTRNRAHYLALSLQSILEQTRKPDLVVVSDDASTDGTPQVIEDYRARFEAAGVAVSSSRHDPALGHEANHRFCLETAEAAFVGILQDDDLWRPTYLERMSALLTAQPAASFAACSFEVIDEAGVRVDLWTEHCDRRSGRAGMDPGLYQDILPLVLHGMPFTLQGSLFRRSALREVGFVPAGSGNLCDLALFGALALRGAAVAFDPAHLWQFRSHPHGRVSDGAATMARDALRVGRNLMSGARQEGERLLLRRACIEANHDLIMELAHAGQRSSALHELATFVREWGLRTVSRRLFLNLPLVLLGADRLRHGRPLPKRR